MIPEEDRGPGWLRDYGYTDFSQIEVDIQAMENFASGLAANVTDSYAPHFQQVSDAMTTQLPPVSGEFVELLTFLSAHREAQEVAHNNIYSFADGTKGLARAAQAVSKQYAGSDAFSQARVRDVDSQLDRFGVPTATGSAAHDQPTASAAYDQAGGDL